MAQFMVERYFDGVEYVYVEAEDEDAAREIMMNGEFDSDGDYEELETYPESYEYHLIETPLKK